MSRVRHLSYTLEETIPAYGKTKVSLGVRSQKSIDRGDSCNTIRFSMENHWGTHIDAPAHFFKNAKNT